MRKNVVISWGTLLGIANDDAQSLEEAVLAVFFFGGGGGGVQMASFAGAQSEIR